jgi:hypothetical protein
MHSPRRLRWAIVLLSIVGAVALLILPFRTQVAEFPNGLTLRFLGVTEGTNLFKDGSPLEKLLGNVIPQTGLRIGSWNLQRPRQAFPRGEADLNAWVLVRQAGLDLNQFKYYWEGSKVIATNASGRGFENPPTRPARISSNEVLLTIPLLAFPRDQSSFRLRIRAPNITGEAERWAEFKAPNPFRGTLATWDIRPLPATNLIDGDAFVVLRAQSKPTQIEVQLPSTNWHMPECRIFDQENNSFSWNRMSGPREGRVVVEFDYGLEGNLPWRMAATFVRSPTVRTDTPPGRFPDFEQQQVTIMSAGPEVQFTNQVGSVYHAQFDGRQLGIRPQAGEKRPYFVLLGATNEQGQAVHFDGGTSWSGRPHGPKRQQWYATKPESRVDLTVACPKSVETEFHFKPDSGSGASE